MKMRVIQIIEQAADTYHGLRKNPHVSLFLENVANECVAAVRAGGTILLAGNGGSASDAQHIAAELVGRFKLERNPIPAIAMNTDSSVLTAISNDFGFEHIFARQIQAYGKENDILILISTSGRSTNILAAKHMARQRGMKVIIFDQTYIDSTNTARIQECHILFGHIICELIESKLQEEN